MIDSDTRLRAACGIAKTETKASEIVFATLKQRGHPDKPPPTISDGWGGIDEAMIAVYGQVPPYSGRGRPPTRKQPGADWQYVQMVKQRENGRVMGTVSYASCMVLRQMYSNCWVRAPATLNGLI